MRSKYSFHVHVMITVALALLHPILGFLFCIPPRRRAQSLFAYRALRSKVSHHVSQLKAAPEGSAYHAALNRSIKNAHSQ